MSVYFLKKEKERDLFALTYYDFTVLNCTCHVQKQQLVF